MARSSKTKYAILGMLAYQHMSGYDIKNMMEKSTNHLWSESPGQIYPTLASLLKEECIAETKDTTKSKHERNTYKITKKGLKLLQEWLPKAPEKQTSRDELLLKIFFAKNMSKEQLLALIKKRRAETLEHIEELNNIMHHVKTEHHDADAPYWLITINSGLIHCKANLSWCDETIKFIKLLKK